MLNQARKTVRFATPLRMAGKDMMKKIILLVPRQDVFSDDRDRLDICRKFKSARAESRALLLLPIFPDLLEMPDECGYERRHDDCNNYQKDQQFFVRHTAPCCSEVTTGSLVNE
jgi:hypothetical protein